MSPESQYRKEIWSLMHNSDDPDLQTAAVRLYMDESGGDDPGTPHAVIGGLLITKRNFELFEDEWEAMLIEHGLLPGLHMKEFGRPNGRFAKMSDCCRRELMQEVAELIEKYKVGSISVSLSNAEFKQRLKDAARHAFGVYGMCFVLAAFTTHQIAAGNKYLGRIPYILDSGNPYANHVRGSHATMIQLQREGLFLNVGGLLFEDDEQFGTLQAADVIAWSARRRATTGEPLKYPFDPLNEIFSDPHRHQEGKWEPQWLSELNGRLDKYTNGPGV